MGSKWFKMGQNGLKWSKWGQNGICHRRSACKRRCPFPSHIQLLLGFMAPEVIRGQPSSTAVDIWGIGCVVLELLTASRPFEHLIGNIEGAAVIFATAALRAPPTLPPHLIISKNCQLFIESCLQPNPSERLEAIERVYHAWVL